MNIIAALLLASLVNPVYVNHNAVRGNTQTMTNITAWAQSVEDAIGQGGGGFSPSVLNAVNMTNYLTEASKTNASVVGRIYQLEQSGGGGKDWDLRLTKAENIPASAYRGAYDLRSLTSESTANTIGIGSMAFAYLPNLKTVSIGKAGTVTQDAFFGCTMDLFEINSGSFAFSRDNGFVPETIRGAGISSVGWYTWATTGPKHIDCPSVTRINYPGFLGVATIETVKLTGCTYIEGRCFESQSANPPLKSFDCGGNVVDLHEDFVLKGQKACTNFNLVAKNPGERAFYNCILLDHMEISADSTTIGREAFGSTALSEIVASNVTSVGHSAFNSCASLTNAVLPSCTTIGNSAFKYCSSLMNITATNVTSIGSYLFNNVPAPRIYFPNCTIVGRETFDAMNDCEITLGTLTNVCDPQHDYIAVNSNRLTFNVGNTMASIRALPGFPWNVSATCRWNCADGYITKDGGVWTDHPY